MTTPFEIAKSEGYNDEEIFNYLKSDEKYSGKIQTAIDEGYKPEEIVSFLSKQSSPTQEQKQPESNTILPNEPEAKQERSAFQKYVRRPTQIAFESGAAGFKTLPRTGYDVLKEVAKFVGGDISKVEKMEEKSPQWLKDFANFVFPTYETELKEIRKGQKNPVIPETPVEKGIEKLGRFTGETLTSGGIGGVRGALGLTGAAAGAQTAEELKLGPWSSAALTIGSSLLGHKVGGGLAQSSRQRITPEVRRYMEASRDLGIDPLLTGMNPSQLQKVAQKWATHGIGGPQILQDAYESRSAQVSRAFETALDEAGENLFTTKYEAGAALRDEMHAATQQVERNKSQLYRAVDRTLPADAMERIGNPSVAQNNLERAIDALDDTLSMSPAESSIHRRATELRRELAALTDHLDGDIPVRTLEATNRSLNDIIRYERPGGVDKLLIPFARDIRNTLDRYGRTNPQYATARRAANDYFANDVVHIRQNLLQSIARSERPESTLAIMNTVSGIRNVERALRALPDGQRMVDALKRYKLSELIRDKIIDPSTGLMKVGGLKNFLSKSTSGYDVIRELAGPRALETLRQLEHVGQGLEKGFNNLVNPSRTADTFIAINSVLSPGKKIGSGISKTLKGNIFEGVSETVMGLSQVLAPRVLSRTLLDPEFARQVYTLSQAAQRNDWRAFNRILDTIDQEIKKDNKEYDKYLKKNK